MTIGIMMFLGLFAADNKEFFDTAVAQQQQGYKWTALESCQTPEDVPGLRIETPIGNKYVCYKLVK